MKASARRDVMSQYDFVQRKISSGKQDQPQGRKDAELFLIHK
jgi:hypothetical protein